MSCIGGWPTAHLEPRVDSINRPDGTFGVLALLSMGRHAVQKCFIRGASARMIGPMLPVTAWN
jgi:hypothetical protein